MKYNKFLIALTLCATLQISASESPTMEYDENYAPQLIPKAWNYEEAYKNYKEASANYRKSLNENFEKRTEANKKYEEAKEVKRLLEWAGSKTKEELGMLKNSPYLDTEKSGWHDNSIEVQARKIVKAKIFSNIDYLTDEEQKQQGWPMDIGVPRNMTPEEKQQLQKLITETINSNVEGYIDHCKGIIRNRKSVGLPPLTMQELTSGPFPVFVFHNNDDTLHNRSVKIAYKNILPLLSYWEQYAPNFIKSIGYKLGTIKNYISSWTVDLITNRLYQTLKRQKEKNDMQQAFGYR